MSSFEFPGEYYEIMRGDFRDLAAETEFLSSLAPAGGRVLDLGCGTGTNLRELGARGFSCLGADQSACFIEYARGRGGEGVEYVHGRAEDFVTDDRFDLVYSLFMTLNYLPRAELRGVLRKVRGLLRPGGHVVLEFGHLLNFVEGFQQHTVGHHRGDDGVLITRLARQAINPHAANWRNEETLLVRDREGRVSLYDNFFDQAVLTGPEVRDLLDDAGLRTVAEYGGFRKEPAPFHGRGPLVIVATAKDGDSE
ncbi:MULTISPECIES: class I SAM-dependent methyltransferase [unclassified Streptomyces]|uniref:class I SAM-dependent methyltransferase n=1 Tax=unclassified Streptomyces TaxID=2593676 RepID=UPI0013703278|nr:MULTISPECIES: class I SAM-dependent methyltransferase [unclassified Streptomyces]MCW5254562.1 methyltransferase domain-containing protein [Streptomyces sp. SHP 1-2]MYU25768.1 methyltransferase domain-containing protein [Streptomyces sp. SID8352]